MAAPRKYSEELKERATRMAVEARRDPESSRGAVKRIADQLGVRPECRLRSKSEQVNPVEK
ncbi:transposase IS3/IS911 family protein [Gordonia polyisoprenivorans VH2]|uniref:Transposase IS3/IS911 family protein n=1 Tax=Gordonia polyisoprenivorans (strain DSM 44266 / VH2) TaxID=1112204 RepID=H6N4K4_GORPV|nr:hypothetical protein [Gordonia polyisoprenivorans]AFA73586.1 transposase IS3/IS911 family protein [Gordonia polyisoprenivorans VH2]